MLIEPGWSLGVELTFYLVAPFILTNRKLLVALLLASLALRVSFIMAGFGLKDPWFYRFFPTELALFLIGALSHQLLLPRFKANGWLTRHVSVAVTVLVALYCAVFFLLPGRATHHVTLFVVMAVALPFLFHFQNSFRWDRKIGDLSYPIYIVHSTIIVPVAFAFDRIKGDPGYEGLDMAFVVLGLTLGVSILLHQIVDKRVERMRDRVRGRKKTGADPEVSRKAQPAGA